MKSSELHRLILKNGWKHIRTAVATTSTKKMNVGTLFLITVRMKSVKGLKRKLKER